MSPDTRGHGAWKARAQRLTVTRPWPWPQEGEAAGPAPTFVRQSSAPLPPATAPGPGTRGGPLKQHGSSSTSDGPQYDAVVCGGTLGIFAAAALAARGLRVAVVERGPLRGRDQEWNISRKVRAVWRGRAGGSWRLIWVRGDSGTTTWHGCSSCAFACLLGHALSAVDMQLRLLNSDGHAFAWLGVSLGNVMLPAPHAQELLELQHVGVASREELEECIAIEVGAERGGVCDSRGEAG